MNTRIKPEIAATGKKLVKGARASARFNVSVQGHDQAA
jgi:hypothetical protein